MNTGFLIWYTIPLLLLLLFLGAYKINRTWMITGILLSGSITSFTAILFLQAYYSDNRILTIISMIPILLVVLLFTYGIYILIAFLIWNTHSILKREKRDLKHFLSFILAIGLLLVIIVPRFIDLTIFPQTMVCFIYSVYGLIIYYLLHLLQFTINMILCNFSRPRKNQNYIIVLGCWIDNGNVPPLLARRIDKAIAFYYKQKERNKPPKLVLSGGKGPDEICPEAEAMKAYALKKGIPEEDLLLETKSMSTLENMKFSKEVMNKASKGVSYRCIYATNNYHVLRAGILARKAGLNMNGIGAKTALYYLPNATLREYIAYIYLHIKWNIAFGMLSLMIGSIAISYFSKLIA